MAPQDEVLTVGAHEDSAVVAAGVHDGDEAAGGEGGPADTALEHGLAEAGPPPLPALTVPLGVLGAPVDPARGLLPGRRDPPLLPERRGRRGLVVVRAVLGRVPATGDDAGMVLIRSGADR